MNKDELHRCLQDCELFNTLGDPEIAQIAALGVPKTFNEGEVVHEQGGRVNLFFVVANGSVALFRRAGSVGGTEGAEVAIDILGPGRVLGWSSLVKPHVATNSPKAMRKSELIAIDGTALRFLLEKDRAMGFEVMQRLAELLASRLRAAYGVLDTKI